MFSCSLQIVNNLLSQYTSNYTRANQNVIQKINHYGNNIKSMHLSVEASLKKLRTSYIDILYVHWWDWGTDVEEVMNALHALVMQGKVLYLVRTFSLSYKIRLLSHLRYI